MRARHTPRLGSAARRMQSETVRSAWSVVRSQRPDDDYGPMTTDHGLFMPLSLKLAALCAAAALIPIFILSLIVLSEVSTHAHEQALEQLRSDARAAAALCEKRQIEMRAAAQALAEDIANRALVSSDNLD